MKRILCVLLSAILVGSTSVLLTGCGEKKEEIKKRLGRSTDLGDALALTFAEMHYPSSIMFQRFEEADFVDDNVYV